MAVVADQVRDDFHFEHGLVDNGVLDIRAGDPQARDAKMAKMLEAVFRIYEKWRALS